MKKILFFLFLFARFTLQAQELFVYTEPASNMPKKSLGIRLGNMLMKENGLSKYEYHIVPELMWGANRNLMLHADPDPFEPRLDLRDDCRFRGMSFPDEVTQADCGSGGGKAAEELASWRGGF